MRSCQIHYMWKIAVSVVVVILFFNVSAFAQKPRRPFPQHARYFDGCIRPDHISQTGLDNSVRNFYSQWKKRFIKNVPGKQQSFVWFENVGNKQCVSEGQGYGMIIVALMAGADPSAKVTYDNLFRYCRAHPSSRNKYLMAWAQDTRGRDAGRTSATDGDMDIAYSLLLADKQWSSGGAFNYLAAAKKMINSIMRYEINHKTWSVLLCDGIEAESRDYFDMRSSDFMPAHFKAFYTATGDIRWNKVIDANYELFQRLQKKYSPDAGLLPDFIVNINEKAKPAPSNFLESPYDGFYNYNACRVPWRIAADYLLTGDKRSKIIANKINRWIRGTTNNDTYNISAGYTLGGEDIKGRYFEALSFVAPFAVSAMVDKKNQAWLNKVWDYLLAFKMKDYDYYDNSIKLFDMIILSGNYWSPSDASAKVIVQK